jgi:hypothetical protein
MTHMEQDRLTFSEYLVFIFCFALPLHLYCYVPSRSTVCPSIHTYVSIMRSYEALYMTRRDLHLETSFIIITWSIPLLVDY